MFFCPRSISQVVPKVRAIKVHQQPHSVFSEKPTLPADLLRQISGRLRFLQLGSILAPIMIFTTWLHFGSNNKEGKIGHDFWAKHCRINE
jgi:hypothetical protein